MPKKTFGPGESDGFFDKTTKIGADRLSEKGVSTQDKNLDVTTFSFAFVGKGTLDQFEDIRSYILRMSGAKLIYQTKSIERLRICKETEAAPTVARPQ